MKIVVFIVHIFKV